MLKILLPVDGSDACNKAIAHFIQLLNWYKEVPEIHLLNVQFPLPGDISTFISQTNIKQYHQDEGMKDLKSACDLLDQAGIAYQYHVVVGEVAKMIVQFAAEKQCDQIVLGPRGLGTVQGMLLGSVASKLIHLSPIPVLLVK
ncbi:MULTISPECIES: universal stress protein [Nitrosomonas]|uniref:Nucleotide-binding universal stress UspA family protein n=1 Tax=Nitrosomonas communis TaxID=44574 RepID=A0A0F7KF34_9PROT|nr:MULTISPECIES: universal stress protein [Nitrosomonas]AKH37409.1 universal stress protein [Nitrosomonas communis]TYP91407.1 nucleotide-binding universal stress UspA family protein [Nitrosomonas communis]UVS62635.1 universal stress protein [Nitrosomonas sp. PLL12]